MALSQEQMMQMLDAADKAGDIEAANDIASMMKETQPDVAQQAQPEEKDYGMVGAPLMEANAGLHQGFGDLVDFWASDPINSAIAYVASPVSEALGAGEIDYRVPTLGGVFEDANLSQGGFMEPGIARDMTRGAGEIVPAAVGIGGALRGAAQQLPKLAPAAESVSAGVMRQMGGGSALADAGYGALAGAGMEGGGEAAAMTFGEGARPIGEVIGAFFAPLSGAVVKKPLTDILQYGWKGVNNFMKNTPKNMSDDGLSTLLAEAMVRENLTPDEVIKKLNALGAEGVPADVGNNFARLLKTATNKVPRVQGEAAEVLNARQVGSGNRINSAMDDVTGTSKLTLEDEITRLDTVMKPKIKQLYEAVGEQGMPLSNKLKGWFSGKNSIGRAQREVERRLADKRSMGDQVTNIDYVNTTKQVLDDQIGAAIRGGNMNKARDLVRLKNAMIEEADLAIPVYKTARDLYSGKISLESAGDAGTLFFKMKPRDMKDITKSYSEGEKRMFRLGAKQAIVDKINDASTTADMVKKLFGKGGDVEKLRYLFDDSKAFDNFWKTLDKEAKFALTRRAIQGNSSTPQQLFDAKSYGEKLEEASSAMYNPVETIRFFGRVRAGLSKKKGEAENLKAMEDAGFLLLQQGTDIKRLLSLLKRGSAKEIGYEITKALKSRLKEPTAGAIAGTMVQEN